MDELIIPARPGAPIACDMTDAAETPPERMAEYGRLFRQALVAREWVDDDPPPDDRPGPRGLRFTFADEPGVQEWLADLVRREAACCPFLSYRVEAEADQIVWTITTGHKDEAARSILEDFVAVADGVGVSVE